MCARRSKKKEGGKSKFLSGSDNNVDGFGKTEEDGGKIQRRRRNKRILQMWETDRERKSGKITDVFVGCIRVERREG